MCALQYSKDTELEVSPRPKLRQKHSDFSLSATAKSLVLFHVGCIAHMIQSSFCPPLSPLSLAFLFIFWSPFPPASLSHIHFPFPSHLSEYFAFGSLYFLKPQSSLFTVLAHVVKLFSPFIPVFLPGQPGTGALRDPSIFQREEITVFWWLIC